MNPAAPTGPADEQSPGVSDVIAVVTSLAGQRQCSMGYHTWTPWLLLPSGSYVTICSRCDHEVGYDL